MIDTVWSQSYNNWLNVEWCRKFVTAICQSYGLNLLLFWQCIGRPYTVHLPAQSICCHTCPKYVVQPICGLVKLSFENKEKHPLQRMSMFSILYFWTLMFFQTSAPSPHSGPLVNHSAFSLRTVEQRAVWVFRGEHGNAFALLLHLCSKLLPRLCRQTAM